MNELRLIDGNEVGAKIQAMYIRREIDYGGENEFCRGMRKALRIIEDAPTIKAQPVGTEKCKALRNIEGIRLILSNVYNTGSTLQDCDYDAIFKRLDVIENILKGE